MDSGLLDGSVVLMSIRPEFVAAILDGRKRVEFRKSAFRRNVRHVVIYATKPVMRIVGFFEVGAIDKGTPQIVWERHGQLGNTDEAFFFSYFGCRDLAVAISIGQVTHLDRPLSLPEVDSDMRPPQSFRYLPAQCWHRITDHVQSSSGGCGHTLASPMAYCRLPAVQQRRG